LKYANAYPKSEKAPDILRRLGVLYYGYNQFDKAIDVFERILRDYPKSPNAEIAGNLILDIYKLKGDMIGLADKGQAMLQNPSIANTAFGTKIRAMMEKASFMKADKLAEKGDPAAAAKQYEQFATSYKASELAVASRFKAAANYEKAGDLVSAMRMHSLILAGDGSDPKIRAVQNDSRNALSHLYQQTGQLELAAKSYHEYAASNIKDTKAINGFFNAGVLFDALADYNQALANYDMYYAKSKNSDRIEVLYLDALIWKKRGNLSRAASLFDRYIKEGGRNQAHIVEAVYEMARNSKRLGQITKQKELWQEVIARYKRAGEAKGATAAFAAEAQFELSQSVLHDLNAIKFYKNAKQQAQAANDIKLAREKYINEMKKVILFDNAKWIIAALTSSGQMFESVARKFDGISIPSNFSEEDGKKYRELITQQSNGFREEAKNSYKTAVDRSQELESYSEWTLAARQGLAGLDPASKAKDAGEVASEALATDWMGL
jgi:tetratricopeptide (TPR) repeat protein